MIEHRNAGSVNRDEVIDESLRLLVVGGAKIEGKLVVGRNSVGAGPGEWEEQQEILGLTHPQQRQRPVHGRCAHIAEQREDVVLVHQLQCVADRKVGVVLVVIRRNHDASAVDTPGVVDRKQVGHGAAIEFDAERTGAPRKVRRHAQADFASAGTLAIGACGACCGFLRWGKINEERGREQEGQRQHTPRAEPGLQVPLRLPLLVREGGDTEKPALTVARHLIRAARVLTLRTSIAATSEA